MPGLQKVLKKNTASQIADRIPNIPQVLNIAGF